MLLHTTKFAPSGRVGQSFSLPGWMVSSSKDASSVQEAGMLPLRSLSVKVLQRGGRRGGGGVGVGGGVCVVVVVGWGGGVGVVVWGGGGGAEWATQAHCGQGVGALWPEGAGRQPRRVGRTRRRSDAAVPGRRRHLRNSSGGWHRVLLAQGCWPCGTREAQRSAALTARAASAGPRCPREAACR